MKKTTFELSAFDCAIFDLDGTLLASTDIWAKIDVDFLGSRGIEVPQDFTEAIKAHNFKTGSVYVAERFGLDEKPEDIANEWFEMAKDAYAKHIVLKKHAGEFLTLLKAKGCKLAVATSSDRVLYEPCLKRNGVYSLFDCFTQTDEVARGKGFPDVYELAAAKCNTCVQRCVVFEDILKGVEGAAEGGFFTVGVYDEASAADRCKIEQLSNIFIEDYAQLMECI